MAWCPNCRLEYRKGITVCSDCGSELVEELDEAINLVEIMLTPDEALADKFLDFLQYSNIKTGSKEWLEAEREYRINVDVGDQKEAKKLFLAFYKTELEEDKEAQADDMPPEGEISIDEASSFDDVLEEADFNELVEEGSKAQEETQNLRTHTKVYMKQEDKYKDLNSSAYIFFIFGIGGLLYVALNAAGILSFINGTFPYVVYTILFLACLVLGVTTKNSAKRAKEKIADENDTTQKITLWMDNNINEESFMELSDENLSDEVNYFKRTSLIKKLVTKQFGNLDEAYLDQIVEDFYNEHF